MLIFDLRFALAPAAKIPFLERVSHVIGEASLWLYRPKLPKLLLPTN